MKTILEKAATVGTLKVVDDQIGSPAYAYDLADAVKRLVDDGAGGIFHITNGGNCNWHEFARAILEEAGVKGVDVLPFKSDEFPRPAKRPCFSVPDGRTFYHSTGLTIRPWPITMHGLASLCQEAGNGGNNRSHWPKNARTVFLLDLDSNLHKEMKLWILKMRSLRVPR